MGLGAAAVAVAWGPGTDWVTVSLKRSRTSLRSCSFRYALVWLRIAPPA